MLFLIDPALGNDLLINELPSSTVIRGQFFTYIINVFRGIAEILLVPTAHAVFICYRSKRRIPILFAMLYIPSHIITNLTYHASASHLHTSTLTSLTISISICILFALGIIFLKDPTGIKIKKKKI